MPTPPRTLVVTVAGFVTPADLEPLTRAGTDGAPSEVVYHEVEHIEPDDLAAMCEGFDVLMLNYDTVHHLPPSFYDHPAVRALRAVATDITGMDWASPAAADAAGVPLLHVPEYCTESVAETMLTEVLLHTRQRHAAYTDLVQGRTPQPREGINLAGRCAGVVGMGNIGTRTAELLAAVGMEVVSWTRSDAARAAAGEPPRPGAVALDELFTRADVVCIATATVTEGPGANVGFVDDDLLSRCHGAVVVNMGRPDLVDAGAMVAALGSGAVVGYSCEQYGDVPTELTELPGVHLAPKDAWSSKESLDALRDTWVASAVAALRGELVNRYLGG